VITVGRADQTTALVVQGQGWSYGLVYLSAVSSAVTIALRFHGFALSDLAPGYPAPRRDWSAPALAVLVSGLPADHDRLLKPAHRVQYQAETGQHPSLIAPGTRASCRITANRHVNGQVLMATESC
jgi:hypothetical protein